MTAEFAETHSHKDLSLDTLIHDLKQKDDEIKLAIARDDIARVEQLDAEIRHLENALLTFACESGYERKTLFLFLVDQYLANTEVTGMLPKGLIERIKGLYQ